MHMNVGLMNFVYKHLLLVDETMADRMGDQLLMAFSLPVWILFVAFWLPMIIVQFLAFSKELTPYPSYARWFSVPVGAIPFGMVGLEVCRSPCSPDSFGTSGESGDFLCLHASVLGT